MYFRRLLFSIIFSCISILSLAQTPASSIERYKKLYLEGKIKGDAYMTLLFTAVSMAGAEFENKLKVRKTESFVSEELLGNAFTALFDTPQPTPQDVNNATETILMSLGFDKNEILKISSDVNNLSKYFNDNINLFSNPEYLGGAMSYLALKTEGLGNSDLISYAAGAGNLNTLSGNAIVTADFAIAAIDFIATAVKEQKEINALNRTKRNFFYQYCLKLSDYSLERNKILYPDIVIDSSNWMNYFNPINFERVHFKRRNKASVRNYRTEPQADEILLTWKETEIIDKRTAGSFQDSVVYLPFFNKNLKFDFSRDFEFHMTVSTDIPIGAVVELKIADNYLFGYTPVLGAKYSDVTTHQSYKYNPLTHEFDKGIAAMVPKKFYPPNKTEKELVLKKVGNKFFAYWVADNQKVCKTEITTFFNRDSFKVAFRGNAYGSQMIIKNVSLKYL